MHFAVLSVRKPITFTSQACSICHQLLCHQKHQLIAIIVLAGGEDGTALEMAFSRKKIEERKAWLRSFVPGTYLDHTASDITYTDFVNKV